MRMMPNEFNVDAIVDFEPEPYHEPIVVPPMGWPLIALISPLILLYWIGAAVVLGSRSIGLRVARIARRR